MWLVLLMLELLLGFSQSHGQSQKRFSECTSNLYIEDANVTEIVECLARTANLTAHWEATLWRMDLLDRVLERLHAHLPTEEPYKHTPYESIDDVLAIKDKMSKQDCQRQRHVVQALRRKLYWHSLMSGTSNTLFDWPWPRPLEAERFKDGEDATEAPLVFATESVDHLRCALLDAIQKPRPRPHA